MADALPDPQIERETPMVVLFVALLVGVALGGILGVRYGILWSERAKMRDLTGW